MSEASFIIFLCRLCFHVRYWIICKKCVFWNGSRFQL